MKIVLNGVVFAILSCFAEDLTISLCIGTSFLRGEARCCRVHYAARFNFASHRGDLRNNRFLPYLCMLFYFSARSKSEDDSLDAYTPSRRDTVSRKDNTLKRDISNASQLSSGNIEIFPCFMISFFSI